ncbi:hypothetical protein N657DRAFT_327020 [Parathielavia appendiculata]|uniref:Uncharacterized protein n=1 Tax=Parathielavia appendiculata TaxID=2587402 RepID=A0AAN6TQI6_9PEZI|nr:hypothetical protein N657DRAFT_327020 [Parathielavia appendiculata]
MSSLFHHARRLSGVMGKKFCVAGVLTVSGEASSMHNIPMTRVTEGRTIPFYGVSCKASEETTKLNRRSRPSQTSPMAWLGVRACNYAKPSGILTPRIMVRTAIYTPNPLIIDKAARG